MCKLTNGGSQGRQPVSSKKTNKNPVAAVRKQTKSDEIGVYLKICIKYGNDLRKFVLFKDTKLSIMHENLLT